METVHPEDGESPFMVKDDKSVAALMVFGDDDRGDQYAACPVKGCGEALLLTELENHLEMHEEEQDPEEDGPHQASKKLELEPDIENAFDTKLPHSLRNLDDSKLPSTESHSYDRQASTKAAWKGLLNMPDIHPKSVVAAASMGTRRRLGVSTCISVPNPPHVILTAFAEIGAGSSRAREADAFMAF